MFPTVIEENKPSEFHFNIISIPYIARDCGFGTIPRGGFSLKKNFCYGKFLSKYKLKKTKVITGYHLPFFLYFCLLEIREILLNNIPRYSFNHIFDNFIDFPLYFAPFYSIQFLPLIDKIFAIHLRSNRKHEFV